jgi:glycosyltransferase involved in cell wall biosynthesis
MDKIRILVTGDRSSANTGFAVYKKNLIEGLIKQPNFEVAELGYVSYEEHKAEVPWKMYTTAVHVNHPDWSKYNASAENKNGAWRWDETILDFKPHIVISPVDPWQIRFQIDSPLKDYYHLCCAPPIDSGPIMDYVVRLLMACDSLVGWTQFSIDEMVHRGLSANTIIPMGVDTDIFMPFSVDQKFENRVKLGLPLDKTVFGFVARNQRRKRIPELMKAFKHYLENYDENAVLYIHTTFPDIDAWNLPRYLMENGLSNHVYFTYRCSETGEIFASLFADKITQSPFSQKMTGAFIDVIKNSPTPQQLNCVYNTFDVYTQVANCEGWGSPILEAASCNVPTVVINHGAMAEVGRSVQSVLVNPKAMHEADSVGTYRAIIDTYALAVGMNLAANSHDLNTHDIVKTKYDWQTQCIQKWVDYINGLNLTDRWSAPKKVIPQPLVTDKMNMADLVNNLAVPFGRQYSFECLHKMEKYYAGGQYNGSEYKVANYDDLFKEFEKRTSMYNAAEEFRTGIQQLEKKSWM